MKCHKCDGLMRQERVPFENPPIYQLVCYICSNTIDPVIIQNRINPPKPHRTFLPGRRNNRRMVIRALNSKGHEYGIFMSIANELGVSQTYVERVAREIKHYVKTG